MVSSFFIEYIFQIEENNANKRVMVRNIVEKRHRLNEDIECRGKIDILRM